MCFCSPINLSLLACSRPSIRLLARTGAIPALDEGCERAVRKTPSIDDILPRAQKALQKLSLLHTPAPAKPHACSPLPLRRLLRRLTKFARRASRGTPCFNRSTYRCPACRSHSCALAHANRRRSKSNDCGARPLESTRETRSHTNNRADTRRSREKTTLS